MNHDLAVLGRGFAVEGQFGARIQQDAPLLYPTGLFTLSLSSPLFSMRGSLL